MSVTSVRGVKAFVVGLLFEAILYVRMMLYVVAGSLTESCASSMDLAAL